jgi:hypothetical protein
MVVHPAPDMPRSQPRACRRAVRAPRTGRTAIRPARHRTCIGRDAAVPRRHLRRQHAVTLERLLKVAARPCARQAEPPILAVSPSMDVVAAEH